MTSCLVSGNVKTVQISITLLVITKLSLSIWTNWCMINICRIPAESCRRTTGIPSALRAPRPFFRREADPFVCFFRYRARLPRPHPGLASPVACSRARAAGVGAEVCQTDCASAGMTAYPFKIRKCYHLLSDGGEKHGFAEWRNGRRRARILLHAQREGPPRAKEEAVLGAGRIGIVSEKLQASYV